MCLTEIVRDYMWLISLVYGSLLFSLGAAGLLIVTNAVGNGIDIFHEILTDSTNSLIKFKQNLTHLKIFPDYYLELENNQYDTNVIGKQLILIMILLSVLFIMTALVGCFIRHSSSNGCIILYMVYIIAIALSVVSAYIVKKMLITIDMEKSLERYQGFTDNTKNGVSWSGLMLHLQCCGVHGAKDFEGSTIWHPVQGDTIDVNTMRDALGITSLSGKTIRKMLAEKFCVSQEGDPNYLLCDWTNPAKYQFPLACCKSTAVIPSGCNLKGEASTTTSNMETGCLEKVNEYVDAHESNVFYICILVVIILVSYCFVLICRVVLVSDEDLYEVDPFLSKLSKMGPGLAGASAADDRSVASRSTRRSMNQRKSAARKSMQNRRSQSRRSQSSRAPDDRSRGLPPPSDGFDIQQYVGSEQMSAPPTDVIPYSSGRAPQPILKSAPNAPYNPRAAGSMQSASSYSESNASSFY